MLDVNNVHIELRRRLRDFYAELDLLTYRHSIGFSGGETTKVTALTEAAYADPASVLSVDVPLLLLPVGARSREYSYRLFQHNVTLASLVQDKRISLTTFRNMEPSDG